MRPMALCFALVAGVTGLQLAAPITGAATRRVTTHTTRRVMVVMKAGKDEGEKKVFSIDFSGLAQLMAMGAGAPMLGDLKKTNFDKPEAEGGAALQFELEANNFFDKKGDIQKGKYFDSGWVDDGESGPGFFENLMSGGKMQREYDKGRDAGKRR
mmetsp:Transcript_21560/g.69603  ORF Transcript_21560/g.69603 Transcript_21560/m.69603 type:complete len:155 (+) Transcript_21560:1773-2237(+)